MKKRVNLSTFSFVLTILTFVLILAIAWRFYSRGTTAPAVMLLCALCFLSLLGLIYMPMSIELKNGELTLMSSFRFKRFNLSDIESVRLMAPTMGARRIVGSGGFMGYWGLFREGDIGRYFAYYGKASDCFLVTLKNGRKYMLGCKDAPEMVDAINAQLKA